MQPELTPKDIERFWIKVNRTGDCWLWTACRLSNGYGQFRQWGAHRIALFLGSGEWHDDLYALHRNICTSKACCNPDHLYWGTPSQNNYDMVAAGSYYTGPRGGRWQARGSQNGYSKLTEDQVRTIRHLHETGITQKQLSIDYGVSHSLINKICLRKFWKHV
jgi:hypothetical protein